MQIQQAFSKIQRFLRAKFFKVTRESFIGMLSGNGIEVGALNNPIVALHLNTKYVDKLSAAQARALYPELANEKLVEVDIMDDAESLSTIPAASQDFVIANHVIEHMANPIKALLAWSRVLKKGGRLFLAVPDKRSTFDHHRALTSLQHLEEDFLNPSSQRDFEHFQDFALNVSCRFYHLRPEAEAAVLAKELWDQKYSIHFHVWDFNSFNQFINHVIKNQKDCGLKILKSQGGVGNETIFVLEKSATQ